MENIIELLIKQKDLIPNQLAVKDEEESFSYEKLFDEVISLASNIKNLGLIKQPIIVKVNRKAESLIAFYAILLSNNYFIPVDEDIPFEKLEKIISSSKAKHYISFVDDELPLIKISLSKSRQIYKINDFCRDFDKNNFSYIIYTSGSTGEPKGVIKTQQNIIDFVNNYLETFSFLKQERIANQTPFFFDASMKDIFLTIALGASLFIPAKTRFSLPLETIKYLNENQITYICWVPSILMMIAKTRTLNYVKPEYLKYVYFVGEVFQPKYLSMWIDALPNIRYFNTYGSSEIMGICLYYEINNHFEGEVIPTGKPIKNNHVQLIDGEIVIESSQIAYGYINHDNSKTFVEESEKRYLHTGDFANYDEEGNIVFSSRKDYQIKHLGYRIELQEIDASISNLSYVDLSATIYDEVNDKIITFVTLRQNIENPNKTIIGDAKNKLQFYMVPNKIVVLDEMPLNPNGKIDRVSLKRRLNDGRN